jgi:hypothetical protein
MYDKVAGTTCHQCRQKTLGAHTSCARCTSLHGSLCGDCLFMRYGENVAEAAADEAWICPSCRGLCNCSFHRAALGWAPTGTLYRRAVREGYLSVAHYLVLTNLAADGGPGTAPPPAARGERAGAGARRGAPGFRSRAGRPQAGIDDADAPPPPPKAAPAAPDADQAARAAAAVAAFGAAGRRTGSFMRQTRVDAALPARRAGRVGKKVVAAAKGCDGPAAPPRRVGLRRAPRVGAE